MSPVYITCQVLPGLFDDEYYVMVNGSAAYYINNRLVRLENAVQLNKPVQGQVQGYLVETADNKSLVQLPGEAVVGGIRTWVDSDSVRAA